MSYSWAADRETLTQTLRPWSRSLEVCLCLTPSHVSNTPLSVSPMEMLIDCHKHRAEYLTQTKHRCPKNASISHL